MQVPAEVETVSLTIHKEILIRINKCINTQLSQKKNRKSLHVRNKQGAQSCLREPLEWGPGLGVRSASIRDLSPGFGAIMRMGLADSR